MKLLLTLAIVEDEDDFAEVVDQFTKQDHEAEERQQEIEHLEEEFLTFFADADSWQEYVHLAGLRDKRHADIIINMARWAFEEGRKFAA